MKKLTFFIYVFLIHNDEAFRSNFIRPRVMLPTACRASCTTRDTSITALLPKFSAFLAAITVMCGCSTALAADTTTLQLPTMDTLSYITPITTLQSSENQLIQLFEQSSGSVVNINTFIEQINVYSMNVMEVAQGTGSGFIWDKNGHIVTNFHVIKNANAAKVTILDPSGMSTTYSATVTGVDPDKDVAVLAIDPEEVVKKSLRPIQVGLSTGLRVGQAVLAIGNPFGLDHTLTTGIISGLGREVRSPSNRPITNVIQTDAAINPGNSGGPLLDSAGRLIGMNTAIYSPSGASAGIGFAIPVDTLKYVVDTLIRDGRVVRPAIGISYLETSQARVLGIDKGVLVLDVPKGSPGYKAGIVGTSSSPSGGINLGDIIVGIDDNEIASEADLFKALDQYSVGDSVTVLVRRSGRGAARDAPGVPVPVPGAKKFVTTDVKLKLTLEAKGSTFE